MVSLCVTVSSDDVEANAGGLIDNCESGEPENDDSVVVDEFVSSDIVETKVLSDSSVEFPPLRLPLPLPEDEDPDALSLPELLEGDIIPEAADAFEGAVRAGS